MASSTAVTKAFAQFKAAAFNSDGKYYLTYSVTYVDTGRKMVKAGDVVVTCDINDNPNAVKNKIITAVVAKGTTLEFTVPNGNVLITEFVSG